MLVPVSDLIASAKMQSSCKSANEAKQFYENNVGTIILDVREPHEVDKACLMSSVHIPRGLLEMKIAEICDTHDVPILIHCAAGGRASLSACTLQMMGYSNVHVIDAQFDEILQVFE